MQGWQTTFLGMRELPHDLSAFELQAFFTFSCAEQELIQARRGDALKLGLALHIGFLRMSGRLLDAVEWCRRGCGDTWATNWASAPPRSPRCAPCMVVAAPCSITSRSLAKRSDSGG